MAAERSDADRRWEQRRTFAFFLLFSAFEIGYLIFQPPTFTLWRDWIIVGGAILFPVMTVISFLAMRNNWTAAQEDHVTMRTLGYIVLAPIILILAVFAGFALFAAFGWFATIPSWAAVIIVLLVLIYLK